MKRLPTAVEKNASVIAMVGLCVAVGLVAVLAGRPVLKSGPPTEGVINIDCAPWDGPAFTIQVPLEQNTSARLIEIRIWSAPRLHHRTNYRFPDPTQKVGSLGLQPHAGDYQRISGTVTLGRVIQGQPVEGFFDATLPDGERVQRSFKARWGNNRPICG